EAKKKQEEEEGKKKKEEEAAKKKKIEGEAKKKQEEEEAKKKKEEEEVKKKKAEEEAKNKKAEDEIRMRKEEDSMKKKQDDLEARMKEEDDENKKKKEKRSTRKKSADEAEQSAMVDIRKKDGQTRKEEIEQKTVDVAVSMKGTDASIAQSSTSLREGVVVHSDAFSNRNAKLIVKIQTLFDNVHEMLLEIKRMFLTNNAGKNLSTGLNTVKRSMLSSDDLEYCDAEMPLVTLFHNSIYAFIDALSRIDLYSEQPETWKALEDGVLQMLEAFGQLQQRSEHLQGTEWRTVLTLYKTLMVILTETRQCIYQRRSTQAESELALSKTSVELQLLQKDLEYIRLNCTERVDLTSKTVESYFALVCKTLTLLNPCVEATVKKPSYSTCVNILLQLTIPVHDLVRDLPSGTGWTAQCITPALKHNLRQLYRVVSLMSQQHITRVRNEREVSIVEEIKRHLLSLDKVLKVLLDLHSKLEMQKELLDTIRRNLITLKSVMM
uniref:Uncharacterized protein n=1 Tax=Anopheles maculatus TaxID=74869 RepID=A0A182SU77_9DIPT